MAAPTSMQEYVDRFNQSQRYFGVGVETGMSVGCPFCGAPDFMEYRILDVSEAMKRGATCKECGRSAKAIFHVDVPGNKQFEIVQTGGDEQPDWLVPKMRRVDDARDSKGQAMSTTSGDPVDTVRAEQTEPTGQHKAYIVLSEEERRKGFVRPYRDSYRHVGERPKYPTSELTPEQLEHYAKFEYVAFEAYPPDSPESNGGACSGRYWTQAALQSGCNTVTTMSQALSETYARDPTFYGATFCCGCNRHLPVSEFTWTADGQRVGS